LEGITRDTVYNWPETGVSVWLNGRLPSPKSFTAAGRGRLREKFWHGHRSGGLTGQRTVIPGTNVTISDGQVGPLAQRLFDEISAIQRGLKPDRMAGGGD